MPFDWNDEQKLAIKSRNGTVLVSAAAGSGKSAVLVERVIRRICDEDKKCPADRLLIVTFTTAAAAELRHKINKALSKVIKKETLFVAFTSLPTPNHTSKCTKYFHPIVTQAQQIQHVQN